MIVNNLSFKLLYTIALQEAVQKITQVLETQGISEDDLMADFQNARKNTR
jgi:hypothetical protein